MNGRTAKLINKLAKRSGYTPSKRRALKRSWYRMTDKQKFFTRQFISQILKPADK